MKLPKSFLGKSTEEEYRKYLESSSKTQEPVREEPSIVTPLDIINPESYIILPQHNLYVAKQKSLHGNNWYKSHEELHKQNARMLTIKEFIDFLLLLKSGDALNGLRKKVSIAELESLYREITEKVNPWRAEHLDARFKNNNGLWTINYNHKTLNGNLQPKYSENLEDCLREDCYVNINSINKQGLPTKNSKNKEIYYWHPRDNAVAWFDANSGGAGLGCSWFADGSYSQLGVRAAREVLK